MADEEYVNSGDPWWARPEDYYDIFGVDRFHRDFTEILEGAYTRLMRKYHPDSAKDRDAAESARINNAHDVLKDPATRRRYDYWLDNGGYEQVHQTTSSSRDSTSSRTSHGAQGASGRSSQQDSSSGWTPAGPATISFSPSSPISFADLPRQELASQTVRIIVRGARADQANTLTIRGPHHPAHPQHNPNHWLAVDLVQPLTRVQQSGSYAAACSLVVNPHSLAPGVTHAISVFVDCAGVTAALVVRVTTAAAPQAQNNTKLLVGGAVAVAAIVLVLLLVNNLSSGTNGSSNQARSPSLPVAGAAANVAQPPNQPPPPPPPPPAPTGPGTLTVEVLASGSPYTGGVAAEVFAQTTNALGKPLEGDRVRSSRVDSSGSVKFTVPAGSYVLAAYTDGYSWGSFDSGNGDTRKQLFSLGPGEQKTVTINLGGLNISVFQPNGSAAPFTPLYVKTQKPDVAGKLVTDKEVLNKTSDGTGLVHVDLVKGLYAITYLSKTMFNVQVQEGQTTSINFTLPPR